MTNFWKILKFFLLAIFIILVQLSFVNSLGSFCLVLYFLIYIFIVYDFRTVFWLTFLIGFILDILSFYTFGIHSLSLVISLFIVNFLSINLFTNRSLYSFWAVSAFFIFFYNGTLYLLMSVLNIFTDSIISNGFFLLALRDLFFILILVTISFYFFDFDKEKK